MNVQLLGAIMLTGLTTFVAWFTVGHRPGTYWEGDDQNLSPWAPPRPACQPSWPPLQCRTHDDAAGAACLRRSPLRQERQATAPEGGTFTGVVATLDSGGHTTSAGRGRENGVAAALEFPGRLASASRTARVAHGGVHQPDAQPHTR
jgi:hypothetical protein